MEYPISFLQQASSWHETDILNEVRFKASLSSGKGGQNVNKVSTKMEMYWKPGSSLVLEGQAKEKVLAKLANKLSIGGELRVVCDEERSQLLNKEKLIEKFFVLLAKCFQEAKARKKSKPTKSSVAERLNKKKSRKEIKKGRGRVDHND